jgi:uncharacterized protein YunC (DUF1805 family)
MRKMESVEVRAIGSATGVRAELQNAVFLLVIGARGYIMCGYLDMATAEKKGDAACMVTNVKSFGDVLNSGIVSVSSKARELGVREGMSGRDALDLLS